MEGMIFAAGLGTRLKPLTDRRPKAMVELAGRPLLEHVIRKMQGAGIRRIVVNVHHFAEQVIGFLEHTRFEGVDVIISDERDRLLDTGGGLLKARSLFTPGEPVLIHNVDILSDLDLRAMMDFHTRKKAYATLAVRESTPGRGLRFNAHGCLKGWENSLTGEQKIVDGEFASSGNYSFCGVHIVSSELLDHMYSRGVFSIIDEYLLQAAHHSLRSFYHGGLFMDLGTPEALARAERILKEGK